MNTRIDFATTGDLDAMADLLAELFTLESDFQPEREKQLRGLRLVLDNPEVGKLFVLRVGQEIVGMANALITVSTAEGCKVLLLEDVIVKAKYRKRKLGRALIDHVLAWASAHGLPRVTLLVDKNNSGAYAFYENLGFQPSAMQVVRKKLQMNQKP